MTGRGSIVVPVVRLGMELVAVVVVPLAAANLVDGTVPSLLGALVAAAVVTGTWGTWVAPRASRRLADPGRLAVELVVFLAMAAAFAELGHPWLGAAALVVASTDAILSRRIEPHPALLGERDGPR